MIADSEGSIVSFDLICPPDYPQLNNDEKQAVCYLLLYSGYFESCTPPDDERIDNVIPASL